MVLSSFIPCELICYHISFDEDFATPMMSAIRTTAAPMSQFAAVAADFPRARPPLSRINGA
jgi:hypothetical protein